VNEKPTVCVVLLILMPISIIINGGMWVNPTEAAGLLEFLKITFHDCFSLGYIGDNLIIWDDNSNDIGILVFTESLTPRAHFSSV